jgi:hypothetical protein
MDEIGIENPEREIAKIIEEKIRVDKQLNIDTRYTDKDKEVNE